MSIQRGEDVIFGVGIEETRGTPVAPQLWIPGRTPSGIAPMVERVAVRETRGSKFASHASEIVQKRAEGDFEFNVRSISLGYFLLPLLGAVSSQVKGGETTVYQHTFSVLPNSPEHPTLTLALEQPAGQSYRYRRALVSALNMEITPDELVRATASLLASQEDAVASYGETDPLEGDHRFRHQDITIKMADDVAGLGAAPVLKVKSLSSNIPNGARVDQNVAELNPGNVIALGFDPRITFEADYQNEDLHDAYSGGEYFALQISMSRADIEIGNSSNPGAVFTFPRCSIENWTPNRPIDEIMREAVECMVHFSAEEAKGVEVVLTNTLEEYEAATS